MEWGVGASQQKTKHIPPNTCYNLPNQLMDFKILLMEHVVWDISKIIQLDPNFVYPNNKNCPSQEWSTEKHHCPQNYLGCKELRHGRLRRKYGNSMAKIIFQFNNICDKEFHHRGTCLCMESYHNLQFWDHWHDPGNSGFTQSWTSQYSIPFTLYNVDWLLMWMWTKKYMSVIL
jgi:hypothetical protein